MNIFSRVIFLGLISLFLQNLILYSLAFSCISLGTCSDIFSYQEIYLSGLSGQFGGSDFIFDILYYLGNLLGIGSSFTIFLSLFDFLMCWSILIATRKSSLRQPFVAISAVSMCVAIIFMPSVPQWVIIGAQRQAISTLLILASTLFLRSKEYFKMFLSILAAVSCHSTSVFLIPFLLISNSLGDFISNTFRSFQIRLPFSLSHLIVPTSIKKKKIIPFVSLAIISMVIVSYNKMLFTPEFILVKITSTNWTISNDSSPFFFGVISLICFSIYQFSLEIISCEIINLKKVLFNIVLRLSMFTFALIATLLLINIYSPNPSIVIRLIKTILLYYFAYSAVLFPATSSRLFSARYSFYIILFLPILSLVASVISGRIILA